MDDLNQAFGGQRVRTPIEEAWHNEMKRKQYDIIRVVNPSKAIVKGIEYQLPQIDFYQEYDLNQFQRIGFNTTIDIPYYIAIRYVEHKKDDIVNFVTKKLHDDYLADRDKKGLPRYTDKATENKETYETDSYPKANDPVIVAEIYGQLWLGLVYEFGRDKPPQNIDPRAGEVDLTPVGMKVLDTLSKKRVDVSESPMRTFQSIPTQPPVPSVQRPPEPLRNSGFVALNQKLSPDEVTNDE